MRIFHPILELRHVISSLMDSIFIMMVKFGDAPEMIHQALWYITMYAKLACWMFGLVAKTTESINLTIDVSKMEFLYRLHFIRTY